MPRTRVAAEPLWIPCDYCNALAMRCITPGEPDRRRFACDEHAELARSHAPRTMPDRPRYEWLDLDDEVMPGLRCAARLLAKQDRALKRLQRDVEAAGGTMTYTLTMNFERGTPQSK
jgi:hypothetical protein